MTLDEAIEELQGCMSQTYKILFPKCDEAHKLTIAAVEWIRNNRGDQPRLVIKLLPGETEE